MTAANIHVPSLARRITLTIRLTGRRELAVRIWLAAQIFKFGGWVAGTNLVLELGGASDDGAAAEETFGLSLGGQPCTPESAAIRRS